MDYFVLVEIFDAFEERGECIGEFIFREELFVEGSRSVIKFYPHVRVSFGVEQPVSVEERPQEIRVVKLLQKRLRLFDLKVVKSLLCVPVY